MRSRCVVEIRAVARLTLCLAMISLAIPEIAAASCWIKKVCNPGEPCDYVEICSPTPPPPGAFTLLSPANGSGGVNGTPTLDWTDASAASSYSVVVSRVGLATPVLSVTTTASSLTLSPGTLVPRAFYTWTVTAQNSGGQTASSNGSFSFSTSPLVLDWSIRDRYGNIDSNPTSPSYGLVVQSSPYDPSIVVLDACRMAGSFFAPGTATYTFSTSVPPSGPVTQTDCRYSVSVPVQSSFSGTVTVMASPGTYTAAVSGVAKDFLVVGLGDSYSSGEGNPDVPASGLRWEDAGCHRSHFSPAALAALQLEQSDPHSTVTFLSAACTGDHTSQVIDKQVPSIATALLPPQGQAPRNVDLVSVGIGGNDMEFSTVVFWCIFGDVPAQSPGDSCVNYSGIDNVIRTGEQTVPWRLNAVFAAIRSMAPYVDSQTRTVLLEYPDPTRRGVADHCKMVDLVEFPVPFVIWGSESEYLSKGFGTRLNLVELSAAARNHAPFTAGLWDEFIPHGYCSDDSWIVSYRSSIDVMGCDPVKVCNTSPLTNLIEGVWLMNGSCYYIDPVNQVPIWPADGPYCLSRGTLHPNSAGNSRTAQKILDAFQGPSPYAVYDSTIGAPICASIGSSCIAGQWLIGGQGATEPYGAANSGVSKIADGWDVGASVDGIQVATVDGGEFVPGKLVTVTVTATESSPVYPISIWYTGRAVQGGWGVVNQTHLTDLYPVAGTNTYTVQYTLPEGVLHAVSAIVRDDAWTVYDADDLAFFVRGTDNCPHSYLGCGSSCTYDGGDVNNCGACGIKCQDPGLGDPTVGGTSCTHNTCHPYCRQGFTLVSGVCKVVGGTGGGEVP
jgi:hypothetical protein